MVITVGYDPIEYEPRLRNQNKKRNLIHVDVLPAYIDKDYRPQLELTGNIAATVQGLATQLEPQMAAAADKAILEEIVRDRCFIERYPGPPDASCTRASDIAKRRHDTLFGYGVVPYLAGSTSVQLSSQADIDDQRPTDALPWAIAACLVRPNEKVLSISGDGGFLFSAIELETAVRQVQPR